MFERFWLAYTVLIFNQPELRQNIQQSATAVNPLCSQPVFSVLTPREQEVLHRQR